MKPHVLFVLMGVFLMTNVFAKNFTLESSTLVDKEIFPVIYTCEGKDISPPLSWKNSPEKTQTFALIFHDPDAPNGTWYHWILYNIPSQINEIKENSGTPQGAEAGKNSWNKAEYGGPCPPPGSTHRYIFTLYALDQKLSIPAGSDAKVLLKAIEHHVLGETTLTLTFGR